MMSEKQAEYFTPENLLMKKTGIGGLSEAILNQAQSNADNLELDVMPYAIEKIKILKKHIGEESFKSAQNDNDINHILHDLVPLDVNIKLTKNNTLSTITNSFLKFTENLKTINNDALNVIRAHVNALDVVVEKNITEENDPSLNAIKKELQAAINRYYAKHK
jgi:hypothetical protein